MEKFGIEISVPMSFTEDDALDVLYKTFDRLKCEKDLASKVIIHPVGIDGHRFDVDFEVFSTYHRIIRMHGTINLVNSKHCDYCGNIVNIVSEELYCQLQDEIKIAKKSSNELSVEAWKYYQHDVEASAQVFNAQFRGVRVTPKKVIFNNPATIVLWSDGTKTVVKRQKGDRYNKETGLAMCYVKKFCGDNTSRGLNDILKLANDKEEK